MLSIDRRASGSRPGRSRPAPRKPVQAMKTFSRQLKRNGIRHKNTASGRATSISISAMITAGTMLVTRRCGETNRPSITNITICASQVAAVEKRHHRIMRTGRPVADDDAGQIDREKSRGVAYLRRAKNHQCRGGDKRRVQALRQRHAIKRQHHQTAADNADDAAKARPRGEVPTSHAMPSFGRPK